MATITKRGESYRIRVSDGYDAHGKQKVRSMTWRPSPGMTPRQIEKELNRQAVLFEEGSSSASSIKLEPFIERFFQERVDHVLKESTRTKYRQLTKRVYQYLGHMRLDKISHRDVQAFIYQLSENGMSDKGRNEDKKLSAKSIRHYLSFLSAVMSYAVELDLIPANPCREIRALGAPKSERKCYSLEEVQHLLRTLEEAPPVRRLFVMFLAYTGCRKGDALGLEWQDIDFTNGTWNLQRAVGHTVEAGTYTDTPKTKASIRTIKLPDTLLCELRKFRKIQSEERLALGDAWKAGDRVFSSGGDFHGNSSMYNWMNRWCQAHQIPFYGLHAFRHFAATQMIGSGIDVRTVSAVLGHAKPSTTLNIYSHEIDQLKTAAVDVIAGAIENNKDQTKTNPINIKKESSENSA